MADDVTSYCPLVAAVYIGPSTLACMYSLFVAFRPLCRRARDSEGCPGGRDEHRRPGAAHGARGASADRDPQGVPQQQGPWPRGLRVIANHPAELLAYCAAIVAGYGFCRLALLRGVEEQSASEHLANIVVLLARGTLVFWLSLVPLHLERHPYVFMGAAVFEICMVHLFFHQCEGHMAHSVQTGASYGYFDLALLLTTAFWFLATVAAGLLAMSCCGRIAYGCFAAGILAAHVGLLMGLPEGVHWHHYHMGFVGALLVPFETVASLWLVPKSLALMVEGVAVWGADSAISEKNTTGFGGAVKLLEQIMPGVVVAVSFGLWSWGVYGSIRSSFEVTFGVLVS